MNGSNGSANGFGSATRSVKNPRPDEEAEVVTTTVDATTGTIVVDKTTKKMGLIHDHSSSSTLLTAR